MKGSLKKIADFLGGYRRISLWSTVIHRSSILRLLAVGIKRSFFTIVGRSESNDPVLSIVGLSKSNYLIAPTLADRNPTAQLLRSLADRNPTIPFVQHLADRYRDTSFLRLLTDRSPMNPCFVIVDWSEPNDLPFFMLYDRWAFGLQLFFSHYRNPNIQFLRSLAYRNPTIQF